MFIIHVYKSHSSKDSKSAAEYSAALKTFCIGEVKIHTLTSDNVTNFKGASLKIANDELSNFFANEFITWKFIPLRYSNFVSLWVVVI